MESSKLALPENFQWLSVVHHRKVANSSFSENFLVATGRARFSIGVPRDVSKALELPERFRWKPFIGQCI